MSVADNVSGPVAVPLVAKAPPPRAVVTGIGLVLAVVLGIAVQRVAGNPMTWAYVIGLALGFVLFHSRFGFTSGWRQLVSVGQGAALRMHMLMLAVAVILFAIILGAGTSLTGKPLAPLVQPVGTGLFVGAFLFGVGMQLGGSCASGTLFSVGSGHTSIVITLGGFIIGSVLSMGTFTFWSKDVWQGPTVSLAKTFGYPGALAMSLAAMAVIVGITLLVGRIRRPPPVEPAPVASGLARAIRGSWPMWVGAVLLAALNAATLYVTSTPWGITSAFALWGSKILQLFGVHVENWAYWQVPKNAVSLHGSVLADRTSVMDFGIMVGALIASAIGGAFIIHKRVPWRTALGAVIGGILMGYGARIAGGCNIGAYFSGIASFSLHGWAWGVMAIIGTYAGLALRPLFGLTNPKPSDSVC